jgi:hypothetical protein
MMQIIMYIIGLMGLSFTYFHDIHVSVSEVDLSTNKAEMIVKTYIDDLQKAVGLEGGEVPADYSSADEMIAEYLQKSISIQIDGKPIQFDLKELSASTDAVWITLQSKSEMLSPPKEIQFSSSFLTEVYNDQTNVVNIRWSTGKNSMLLNRKNNSQTLELK